MCSQSVRFRNFFPNNGGGTMIEQHDCNTRDPGTVKNIYLYNTTLWVIELCRIQFLTQNVIRFVIRQLLNAQTPQNQKPFSTNWTSSTAAPRGVGLTLCHFSLIYFKTVCTHTIS